MDGIPEAYNKIIINTINDSPSNFEIARITFG